MMSDLRKVMQDALTTIFAIENREKGWATQATETVKALRAALAEPEQSEPVAHCRVRPLQGDESSPKVFVEWIKQPVPGPLFAAPPRREPLTDEQAKRMAKVGPAYAPDGVVTRRPDEYRREIEGARLAGIRLAEEAHRITGKP
jgi:hypothetical protein